jgi:hypothetical protein
MHDNPEESRAMACEWLEIGIVADPETLIAARVSIQHGGKYPLPSIQLGTLIGDDRRFSPYIHPPVAWTDGKGTLKAAERLVVIPKSLQAQINELLKPHLIERRPEAIKDLLNYTIVQTPEGHGVITKMGCLSCS